jgi:hypothetical protein
VTGGHGELFQDARSPLAKVHVASAQATLSCA